VPLDGCGLVLVSQLRACKFVTTLFAWVMLVALPLSRRPSGVVFVSVGWPEDPAYVRGVTRTDRVR